MAKRSYSHGTPEQMLAAFQNKVAELGGDVSACRAIQSASYVDTDGAFGEPGATITEQEIRDYWNREHLNDPSLSEYGEDGFEQWYNDTKQWLSPVKADSYKSVETNAEATSRFIHTLVGDVNAALEANSELDSWTWEEKEDDLVLTTIAGDAINEYSIPKSDLTLDWDRISEDVDYILNEVQNVEDDEVFDSARHSDVIESSADVEPNIIPAPYDKYYEIEELSVEDLDGMYQVGDEIDGYDCHVVAYLTVKPEFEGEVPSDTILVDDEEYPVVELAGGRIYPVEVPAEQYTFIKSKQVKDSDGFMTDYTMYYDTENDGYVFVFGDNEVYKPEDGDFDYECETEEEANEWFDSYEGFAEDDDEYNEDPEDEFGEW